jgi:hypothetical protein
VGETLAGSIGAEIARRRADRFVGRDDELTMLDTVLAAPESSVVWVFGPGGVGKSALLDAMVGRARSAGADVVTVDLRALGPTPAALHATIDPAARSTAATRFVLVLDALDRAAGMEPWLRDEFLPSLPADTVVIVGSRLAPRSEWRCDPAWTGVLRLVPLRNLAPDAASTLLGRLGVDEQLHGRAQALARGHPLALVLVADLLANGATEIPTDLAAAPELVAELVARLIDVAPDDAHRRGLDAAALSRVTSRGLLRHLVGDAADDVFDWLRERPYVDSVADGLAPQDLARDALEGHLRWSDPDRYASLQHAIREYVVAGLRTPGRREASVDDLVFLHRGSSTVSGYWDWSQWGTVSAGTPRVDEVDVLADIVLAHDGPAAVPILRHWFDRMRERFTVVRRGDAVEGFFALLVLTEPTVDDLRIDPCMAAVWGHACRNDPLRPGQVIGVNRFFVDRIAGKGPSATFNLLTTASTRHWIGEPGLAWDYIVGVPDRTYWDPMMAYLDFHPADAARYVVGDTEYMVYAHDWRRMPADRWLDMIEAREIGAGVEPPPPTAPTLVVLSRTEFETALKRALRDLGRPERLAANPLLGSRVVGDTGDAASPATLRAVVRDAFGALEPDPRTETARRALERTYLRGAVSQEAAAEALGMAFSTYRRHLAAGVELLLDVLWQWELYGRSDAVDRAAVRAAH